MDGAGPPATYHYESINGFVGQNVSSAIIVIIVLSAFIFIPVARETEQSFIL